MFLLCLHFSWAQVDSLKALLKTRLHDTTLVSVYTKLSDELLHSSPDESFKYAYKGLSLAKKINFERGIGECYTNLGFLHSFNSDDSSLFYLFKAQEIKQDLKDPKGVAAVCTSIGTAYDKLGNFEQAQRYYLKALKLFDSLSLDKGIAGACLGLGNSFSRLKNHTKSIEYFQRSIDVYTKINSPYRSWPMNNLAGTYLKIGEKAKAKELYERSLKIKLENKDYYGAVFSIDNIGAILLEEGNFKEALSYFTRALELDRQNHFEKETFANAYCNIAIAMLKMKRNSLAKRYLDSLGMTIEHLKLYELSLNYLKVSSDYYKATEDYKNAFAYNSRYLELKDSMLNSEMSQQMTEADARYTNEKKKKDIELLQKDKALQEIAIEKQQTQRNGFIAGFVIVFILSIFIFKEYRQKQKANILITEQKKVVEEQKHLVEEKQKEIIDSINYAKRIQNTLMAHADFVNANLPENFILFKPKDIVSGDFYWATKKDHLFYLAACDSTGHGVPGAFMSLLNIGFLTEAINEKNIHEPNKILDFVRGRLISTISKEGQQDGFDGILVCIDQKKKKLTYSAAHNAPVVISNNEIVQLESDKMPVGKGISEVSFRLFDMILKPNDTLYLYTDGYADQFGGPKGKKFLYKKMNQLIASISVLSLIEQKERLETAFEDWKGSLEQVDDVLVIGIKV